MIMMRRKRQVVQITKFVVTLAMAIAFFAPFVLLILNSFKPLNAIMTNIFSMPDNWMISNYLDAWNAIEMPKILLNTTIVTFTALALIMLLSSMIAYWFVRSPTLYSRIFQTLLIGSLIIPFASIMLLLYSLAAINPILYGLLGKAGRQLFA